MLCTEFFEYFSLCNPFRSPVYQKIALFEEQDLQVIQADIKNQKENQEVSLRLKAILDRFSYENSDHPLMQQQPKICVQLIPIIISMVNNGSMQKETAKKIVIEFARCHVFVSAEIENDITVNCSDGTVKISKNLLILNSDYFKRLFGSDMQENLQNNIDYSNVCSSDAFNFLKDFYYKKKVQLIQSKEVLLHFFYFVRLIEEKVLINSCVTQIKILIDGICTSKQNLEEAAALLVHIQEYIQDFKIYQCNIVELYLKEKKISYIQIKDSNNFVINISNINEFKNKNNITDLLKIYIKGVSITSSQDIEHAIIALWDDETKNVCKSFTHLHFDGGNAVLRPEVAQLAGFFPEISSLIIQTNKIFYGIGNLFECTEGGPDGFLRGLSFLNVFINFEKLKDVDLRLEKESDKFKNLVITYEGAAAVQAIASRVQLHCDFGNSRNYFAVHKNLYSKLKTSDAVFKELNQIPWFSNITPLQITANNKERDFLFLRSGKLNV